MDWFSRISAAIDYIEENLKADLDMNRAVKIACSSRYHFHRMFFAMVGVTPAEYVRRRRLTLAAKELAIGDKLIINIAADFGYVSPNAFTRAFRNMHGMNPSQVRSPDAKLSAYHRVSLQGEINGGKEMDYRIVEIPAFDIVGKSKAFEFEHFTKEGPRFWKDYVATDDYKSLWDLSKGRSGAVTQAPLMSAYFPDDFQSRESFIDILGIEAPPDIVTEKFEVYTVPAATYAEFDCSYQTSMKTNRYIYGEWFASTGYERDGDKPDIAAYFPIAFRPIKEMGVRWWIPVVSKR